MPFAVLYNRLRNSFTSCQMAGADIQLWLGTCKHVCVQHGHVKFRSQQPALSRAVLMHCVLHIGW